MPFSCATSHFPPSKLFLPPSSSLRGPPQSSAALSPAGTFNPQSAWHELMWVSLSLRSLSLSLTHSLFHLSDSRYLSCTENFSLSQSTVSLAPSLHFSLALTISLNLADFPPSLQSSLIISPPPPSLYASLLFSLSHSLYRSDSITLTPSLPCNHPSQQKYRCTEYFHSFLKIK